MDLPDPDRAAAPARPRGRPRRVAPEAALDAALDAFWQGGYSATSLDRLSEATGLARPSLYATFGDKQQLYLATLARFAERMAGGIGAVQDPSRTLREALLGFYRGALDVYLDGEAGGRGCLVICTAVAEATEAPAIRDALADTLARIDAGLEARFRRAQVQGELPPQADPALLAMLAAGTLHSLAVRARAGAPRAALEAFAEAAVQLYAGAAPVSPEAAG